MRLETETKFWLKVDKNGPIHPTCGQCWIWTGFKDRDGYGTLRDGKKRPQVHRYSWILHNGVITSGLYVCHTCDTPSCVNPEHLFLATNAMNTADKVAKNRQAKGEDLSKLTEEQVRDIRTTYIRGSKRYSTVALARKYNVSSSLIGFIVSNKLWKHIT